MKYRRLKLLTYNVGLARVMLWGKSLYEPMPFVSERFAHLPHLLMSLEADIIALQEIYEPEHQATLKTLLAKTYPYVRVFDARSALGLNDGLMLFSKYPILEAAFIPFTNALLDDRFVTRKGTLRCRVLTSLGEITIFNAYMCAGGLFRHPELPSIDAVRQLQINQLLLLAAACPGHVVLMGDFNTGPEVSLTNYASLLNAGYIDTYAIIAHGPHTPTITWDPTTPINKNSPHHMCRGQRIDHILLRKCPWPTLYVGSSGIVAFTPDIETRQGVRITTSDHFGLVTVLCG